MRIIVSEGIGEVKGRINGQIADYSYTKIELPIKFNRAAGDDIISTAADDKGTALI
ncbi:hypothetical protein H8B09_18305 [Paenibacillus sp. PR3]|uniref:Uncharacterized protein n=1 Tax=Paenibacillus terricola TaxID=2763503 RepID=A0ABR8MXN7_9BACL|nr:hypothetical protein [Paenibacillus terricola]MBD3920724.1 hypothetical protein [Paenibacillus terricola]